MVRFAYKGTMYVNDTDSFDALWYPAADDAQQFTFPTAFGSSRYSIDNLPDAGIGEVWQKNPPLYRTPVASWAKGDHICGTIDQWQNGYPTGTPIPPLGPDGLPACCGVRAAAYDLGFDLGFDS
jgi:hypothetical protein